MTTSATTLAETGLPSAVGPYRIVREIGRGGMGLVYEAVHAQLGKRVAVKVLRPHVREDRVHVQRLVREGRAACLVSHPHVIEIYELGHHDGAPYLAMELIEGVNLGHRLRANGPMPLTELADLMLPVLSALATAHAAGIVHRDLKPSNIMVTRARDGTPLAKLLDFGTSKLRGDEEDSLLTGSGTMLGTPQYMSPEQARAAQDADARSDQYSVALILYECATGRRPFSADTCNELMQVIMTAPIAPPSMWNPALPTDFDEIVLRATNRQPEARYPSIVALGSAWAAFASPDARAAWQRDITVHASVVTHAAQAEADVERQMWEVPSTTRSDEPSVQAAVEPVAQLMSGHGAVMSALAALVLTFLAVMLAVTLQGARVAGTVQPAVAPHVAVSQEDRTAGFISTAASSTSRPLTTRDPVSESTVVIEPLSTERAPSKRRRRVTSAQSVPMLIPVPLGANEAPILE